MNIFDKEWLDIYSLEIPDNTCLEQIHKRSLSAALEKVLGTLCDRERICIKEYFYEDKNYKEIGTPYRISGTRIQQIIAKGLRKLRDEYRVEMLAKSGIKEAQEWLESIRKNKIESFAREIIEREKREKDREEYEVRKQENKIIAAAKRDETLKRNGAERKRLAELNRIQYEELQKEIDRRNDEQEKERLRHRYIMEGNGVPYGICLSVNIDDPKNPKYYLEAFGSNSHLLASASEEQYHRWMERLIERAEWIKRNYH